MFDQTHQNLAKTKVKGKLISQNSEISHEQTPHTVRAVLQCVALDLLRNYMITFREQIMEDSQ